MELPNTYYDKSILVKPEGFVQKLTLNQVIRLQKSQNQRLLHKQLLEVLFIVIWHLLGNKQTTKKTTECHKWWEFDI